MPNSLFSKLLISQAGEDSPCPGESPAAGGSALRKPTPACLQDLPRQSATVHVAHASWPSESHQHPGAKPAKDGPPAD